VRFLPEVRCAYCGTVKEFRDAIHREESRGDFRKYYHFCDAKHLAKWQEELKRKSEEPSPDAEKENTEIF